MPVHTAIDGQVFIITIDRPEARNAVDRPTAEALVKAFREFEANDDLSVAVLTGASAHGSSRARPRSGVVATNVHAQ